MGPHHLVYGPARRAAMCYTRAMAQIHGASGWREATRLLLDTVFPPRCVGCRSRGTWLCAPCLRAVDQLPLPLCPVCRQPVEKGNPHACRAAGARPPLAAISAAGAYAGPLRAAIHALKYEGRHGVAATLAPLLAERVAPLAGDDDLLIPIPLHPARQRERGYNQSAVVAAELARLLPLELAPAALQRTRQTADQTRLSGAQRAENVRDAFVARPDGVRDRRIWLLDDVYTTGATLHAGAAALRAAGAREVRGVVVAMTLRV